MHRAICNTTIDSSDVKSIIFTLVNFKQMQKAHKIVGFHDELLKLKTTCIKSSILCLERYIISQFFR